MEEKVEKNMASKVVVVTGAARGIGRCIAEYLARKGYIVVADYNKSDKEAIQLKENLKKENINIEIFRADVSNRAEVKELIEYAIRKYSKID